MDGDELFRGGMCRAGRARVRTPRPPDGPRSETGWLPWRLQRPTIAAGGALRQHLFPDGRPTFLHGYEARRHAPASIDRSGKSFGNDPGHSEPACLWRSSQASCSTPWLVPNVASGIGAPAADAHVFKSSAPTPALQAYLDTERRRRSAEGGRPGPCAGCASPGTGPVRRCFHAIGSRSLIATSPLRTRN